MPIDSGYGLLGSPILFDIHTLVVQRQIYNRKLPWPLGIFITSPYFISRLYILQSSCNLLVLSYFRENRSTLQFLLKILKPSSYTLRLVTASNAPPSTYYRSCWHVVSPGFSSSLVILQNRRTNFTTVLVFTAFFGLSSPQCPGSSFRLLTNIPHCCRRQGIFHSLCDWKIFQSSYEFSAVHTKQFLQYLLG